MEVRERENQNQNSEPVSTRPGFESIKLASEKS